MRGSEASVTVILAVGTRDFARSIALSNALTYNGSECGKDVLCATVHDREVADALVHAKAASLSTCTQAHIRTNMGVSAL